MHGDQFEVAPTERNNIIGWSWTVMKTAFDGGQADVVGELLRGANRIVGGDDDVVKAQGRVTFLPVVDGPAATADMGLGPSGGAGLRRGAA